jgi:hypothetical protein
VQILFKVTTMFFFYLVWYAFLVVSFGISLFIIFGSSDFYSDCDSDSNCDSYFDYSDFRQVLFLMFFLLVTMVVLMNLLNGLAVSDTNEIRADSDLIGIQSILEFISFWESFLLGDPDGRCLNIRCPFGRTIWRLHFQLLRSGKTKYKRSTPSLVEEMVFTYSWKILCPLHTSIIRKYV